jgi:DNA polymerase III epsilon subunit-like protein
MNKNFKNLLFIDTETTGREDKDRVFQVAYDFDNTEYVEMFEPPLKLCIEAMEATGYTNRDVAGKLVFKNSEMQKHLQGILSNEENIFIAHNAPFDIAMLEKDNVFAHNTIDTLKIARVLDNNAQLGAYRLQYLRYALDLRVEDAHAHDALGDVRVLKVLFNRLYDKLLKELKEHKFVIEKMIEISNNPVEIRRITFGKYNGKLLTEIARSDSGYLEWLLKQKENDTENDHDQNEDWIHTLKKVLGR